MIKHKAWSSDKNMADIGMDREDKLQKTKYYH